MPTGRGRATAALFTAALLLAGGLAACSAPRGGDTAPPPSATPSATARQHGAEQSPYLPSSPFGVVKGGVGDSVIAPTWVKTIWTPQALDGTSVDVESWRSAVERARRYGQVEVPVVADDVWKSGDIPEIQDVMRQFFQADPHVPVWEMGLEENLRSGWAENLPDTARKLAAVQEVKDSVDPRIRLAYQLADRTGGDLETFLKSDASDYTDIISLHPYAWPDFQTPERWLDPFLARVRKLEAAYDKRIPVWFTEVGAPTNDAGGQLYSGSEPVSGLSPEDQADYLVKVYATALNQGVEKVFWYEYEDSCSSPSDAECHFGLKYADGTPKPAYHAYAALSDCIGDKRPAGERQDGGTRISTFRNGDQECAVVWNYPSSRTTFRLSTVGAASEKTRAFDVTGDPVSVSQGEVTITGSPVLLEFSR